MGRIYCEREPGQLLSWRPLISQLSVVYKCTLTVLKDLKVTPLRKRTNTRHESVAWTVTKRFRVEFIGHFVSMTLCNSCRRCTYRDHMLPLTLPSF